MSEIKCPKCGEIFQIDESSYNTIVTQIKDKEWEKQLKEQEKQFSFQKDMAVDKAVLATKNDFNRQLADKDLEIEKLRNSYEQQLRDKDSAISNIQTAKDFELKNAIQNKDAEITKLQNELNSKDMATDKAVLATQNDFSKQLADKNVEIAKLKDQLSNTEKEKKHAIEKAQLELQMSFTQELHKKSDEIHKLSSAKEQAITALQGQLESKEKDFEMREQNLQNEFKEQLKLKDEEIEKYKDFKARLSTKMLGETLEQHCKIVFEQNRSYGFQKAYFEKDNDIRTGSKGDFIYKDYTDDGIEFVSIMFEMKNEADTTATKKKNEDFLEKLNKDREEKKCEYAVLVSMLEADNELYNTGIVDVSHKYPKMYVVRPQFFMPIISLIKNAALNSIKDKRELANIKNQNIDITNFEISVENFKKKISNNYRLASERFDDVIKNIDDTIKNLNKVKENLELTRKHLGAANNNAEDLTIKKLTKDNPTMIEMFNNLNNKAE